MYVHTWKRSHLRVLLLIFCFFLSLYYYGFIMMYLSIFIYPSRFFSSPSFLEHDVGAHDEFTVVDVVVVVVTVTGAEKSRAFVDGRVFGVSVREAQDRATPRYDGVTDDNFFVVIVIVIAVDGIKRRLAAPKGICQVDEKRETRRLRVFFIAVECVRVDDEFVGTFVERATRPSAVEMSAIDALIVVFEYPKPRVYADWKPIVV